VAGRIFEELGATTLQRLKDGGSSKKRPIQGARCCSNSSRSAPAGVTALEQGKATDFTWPTAQAFFNTVRTHTMEGMFADPIYGGNKDFAGWRLVGFPGAHPAFTPADMQSDCKGMPCRAKRGTRALGRRRSR
jgi:hypothetical protein